MEASYRASRIQTVSPPPSAALWDTFGTQWRVSSSIRFQAERKAENFLGETDLRTGFQNGSLTLDELGVTQKESHRFQLLADVPRSTIRDWLSNNDGSVNATKDHRRTSPEKEAAVLVGIARYWDDVVSRVTGLEKGGHP